MIINVENNNYNIKLKIYMFEYIVWINDFQIINISLNMNVLVNLCCFAKLLIMQLPFLFLLYFCMVIALFVVS